MPIRRLTERHRPGILKHLLGLTDRDRYLRFGYPASDERIRHYVAELDFQRDELFGIFNRRLELVARVDDFDELRVQLRVVWDGRQLLPRSDQGFRG